MRVDARQRNAKRPRGTVLIVSMWIVLVLAGLVLVFGMAMRVELSASANHVAALQADAIAAGALRFVVGQLDGSGGNYQPDGSVSFEAVPVGDGYFWILMPLIDDEADYSFGIRSEASLINLNGAGPDMLIKLPNMTMELAAAIIDWRDPNIEASAGGAGSEYYLLLPDPYYCKNGPFETVEELLLVKDVTPEILYGADISRDGRLQGGLYNFLTVYSREPNLDKNGEHRINVNDRNTAQLSPVLREAVGDDRFFPLMDRLRATRPFDNILDFKVRLGLTSGEFALIADRLTTRNEEVLTGMIDVNHAPREVLLCLPELDERDVDALIARRNDPMTDRTSIAWVADALEPPKAAAIGGLITTLSYQFSADILAASPGGRAFRRYRAVIDASTSPPRVLYWKDQTHRGWPLDPGILAAMRDGHEPHTWHRYTTGGAR